MIANCYFRFSHTDQSKGASISRQREESRRLIESKGWILGDEYIDEGKSASKARHRAEGAELYRFEQEARDCLHVGNVLVVEKLDRLSRRGHDDTYSLIKSLGDAGVHIATCDGQFFEAGKPLNLIQVMTILIKAETAREEVAKKGERVKDAHARRYAKAAETGCALGKLCPAWLRVDEKTNKYVVIDERAELVRRIFRLSIDGYGTGTIATMLNKEKIATWQRWSSRPVRAWDRGRVCRILCDESVLGWRKSTVKGREPIRIYPPIVDADVFERVREAAPIRRDVKGGGRSKECANLVSGVAKCAACGSTMTYERKHAWGAAYTTKAGNEANYRSHQARLICRAGMYGGCRNKTGIAYHSFEKALLDAALHIALDDRAFVKSDDLSKAHNALAEATQNHRRLTDRAERMWSAWSDEPDSDMRRALAEKAEKQAAAAAKQVRVLTAARDKAAGRVSRDEHSSRIADIRNKMIDADDETRRAARKKAMEGFRSVITDMWCDEDGVATIAFAGGMAAVRIAKGKVIANADAAPMFADGKFQALDAPAHTARAVYDRLVSAA